MQDTESDKDYIRKARAASNAAIAEQDAEEAARFWMKDIVVISGEGGQYSGRNSLQKIFKKIFDSSAAVLNASPLRLLCPKAVSSPGKPAAGNI